MLVIPTSHGTQTAMLSQDHGHLSLSHLTALMPRTALRRKTMDQGEYELGELVFLALGYLGLSKNQHGNRMIRPLPHSGDPLQFG